MACLLNSHSPRLTLLHLFTWEVSRRPPVQPGPALPGGFVCVFAPVVRVNQVTSCATEPDLNKRSRHIYAAVSQQTAVRAAGRWRATPRPAATELHLIFVVTTTA